MKKMKCGACGGETFTVFKEEGKTVMDFELVIKCSCGSSTVVTPYPAKLYLEWGEESKGILAVF